MNFFFGLAASLDFFCASVRFGEFVLRLFWVHARFTLDSWFPERCNHDHASLFRLKKVAVISLRTVLDLPCFSASDRKSPGHAIRITVCFLPLPVSISSRFRAILCFRAQIRCTNMVAFADTFIGLFKPVCYQTDVAIIDSATSYKVNASCQPFGGFIQIFVL